MARPISNTVSETHLRVLRAIAHIERGGGVAFIMDLVSALGLKGESSLTPTLGRMVRQDLVVLKGGGQGRSRVVKLTPRGRAEIQGGLPLLGSIPAGLLEEAIEQAASVFDERELLRSRPGDFLLQVKGDSMNGDGILEGDMVLLRPGVVIQNGEIAAVLVGPDFEATLKRVFYDEKRDTLILRASNPRYEDRIVHARDVRIAGVFRGLIRTASKIK